ncbi:MAG: 3-dehydroquinate synthase [Myxococcota bacterium]
MRRNNITLIGPPGVGKSSAGKQIAQQLSWRFIDTDVEVTKRLGMPVHKIIETLGRPYFRQCERQVCLDLAHVQRCVIATGGGFPVFTANRKILHEISHVYSLKANAETLVKRLATSKQIRPGLNGKEQIQELLHQRFTTYTTSSFLPVNTHNKPALQVAKEIVQRHQASSVFTTSNTKELVMACAGCAPYPMHIHQGGLQHIGSLLRFILGDIWRVAVLADKTVWQHHGNQVAHSLHQLNQPFDVWLLSGGERSKSMRTVTRLHKNLLAKGFTRDSCVLALGGGCINDLAGFVAATFARGIPWVALPTSLLAMVDACVGGKTAVNLPQAKNAVGAFHPPKAVLLDPNTLQTLPTKHLQCGVAEIIKHGLLGDNTLLRMLHQPNCCLHDEHLLHRAIQVKAAIVQEDPFEQGQRVLLNLGHTFAHALEHVTNYKMHHGSAVALGLLAAAHLSYDLGHCSKTLPAYVKQLLEHWELPTKLPTTCIPEAVQQAMQTDKKRLKGELQFVLLKEVGCACTQTQVPPNKVLRALSRLQ